MKSRNPKLAVNIAGVKMKNPVMCASGTFGFGEEYGKLFDLGLLGAVVTKTITLKPKEGNAPPRIKETPCGMLNSIGLQNPGVEEFKGEKLPFLKEFNVPVIVSIAGETKGEYVQLVESLGRAKGIAAIEINISCPNVKSPRSTRRTSRRLPRGPGARPLMFAHDVKATAEVVGVARRKTGLPLIVKLSPNVADIRDFARASEDSGADAISLINTPIGMAINLRERRPWLSTVTGGLSGPAIKPIALRMVWEVYNTVKIPVIGMGGIMSAADALEFMVCGATAVAIGTANFVNPGIIPEVVTGIKNYLKKYRIKNVKSLVGTLKV